jgi:hypothetical protein
MGAGRPRTESHSERQRYGGNGKAGVFAHVSLLNWGLNVQGHSIPVRTGYGNHHSEDVMGLTKMRFSKKAVKVGRSPT